MKKKIVNNNLTLELDSEETDNCKSDNKMGGGSLNLEDTRNGSSLDLDNKTNGSSLNFDNETNGSSLDLVSKSNGSVESVNTNNSIDSLGLDGINNDGIFELDNKINDSSLPVDSGVEDIDSYLEYFLSKGCDRLAVDINKFNGLKHKKGYEVLRDKAIAIREANDKLQSLRKESREYADKFINEFSVYKPELGKITS